MHTVTPYEDQQESARRAFGRVFVAGLARRMARSGLLRALALTVAGKDAFPDGFPSRHLHTCCDSANREPLRRSGVAAGGAGGGGPGDGTGLASYIA